LQVFNPVAAFIIIYSSGLYSIWNTLW